MKIKILLLSLLALTLFTSCIKDQGTYELKDLGTPTITTFTKGNATIGDPYIIKPVIDYNGLSEDDFEYFWFANMSDYSTADTLSLKKDLSFVFTKAGWYIGVYQIKNKKTGGIISKVFDFNVVSKYQLGWVILSEKNGNSVLSYSRLNSGKIDTTFVDLYSSLYGANTLGKGPLSLGRHYSSSADQILVVQNGEGGAVELNGTNFAKVITSDKEFVDGSYPSGFSPIKAEYGERIEMIIGEDGRAYTRINASGTFQTTRYSNVAIDNAKITKTHYRNSQSYILMYDELNKRCMGIQDLPQLYTGKLLYVKMDPLGGNATEFTDLANMGTDSKLIYIGSYASGSSRYFVQIIKKGSRYRIQKFMLRLETAIQTLYVINGTESDFLGNGTVTDNTHYFLTGSQYLFFGEGNGLYYYDFDLNIIKRYTTFTGNVTAIESNSDKNQIGVGLDNGEFHIFNISNEILASGIPTTVVKVTNLGKVVDVQYKYGNYKNFNLQK
ncbi:MAG: PKD-like family lipoprotein [Rikenellaceae bacterium]|nr:PKD-like family lipoprotein [Rikenellaceae bacterium]